MDLMVSSSSGNLVSSASSCSKGNGDRQDILACQGTSDPSVAHISLVKLVTWPHLDANGLRNVFSVGHLLPNTNATPCKNDHIFWVDS